MKARLANLRWKMGWILAAIVVICAVLLPHGDNASQKAVDETRQNLRRQGFKTDLADFDFSTSPEMRAREAILKATVSTNRLSQPFVNHPNLMEAVGTNSAIVVWKLDSLRKQYRSWPDDGDELNLGGISRGARRKPGRTGRGGCRGLVRPHPFQLGRRSRQCHVASPPRPAEKSDADTW